ncbi:hypothetical protein GLOIN_2v1543781 [Rhizophagus irregularis DAOM 181602=DAOM 197198]|nr:hypothetical protein GLOIN_2v1543781 [Rhizophagus irregularis DAOM 181602=DAOM 197198]
MDISKYNGNIHPDEWILDIQKYSYMWEKNYGGFLNTAISLVDPTIKLPTEIRDIEELQFEDIIAEESNLIKNDSVVALKHVATGKYLNSAETLCYTTGSRTQLVFAGSPVPGSNSLWKIKFGEELATNNTSIKLQHIKSSNKFLGTNYDYNCWRKSPSNNHTEVSCNNISNFSISCYWYENWKFNYSKLENHQGYLKSNDIINLSIEKSHVNNRVEFLRSHDIQFTIGNDTFQEVVCHNERLGGNDEWRIELIKQHIWTIDTLHY